MNKDIVEKFEKKFVIPRSHWPKWSDYYKEYKKDIWGKYGVEDLEQFLIDSLQQVREETIEEVFQIGKERREKMGDDEFNKNERKVYNHILSQLKQENLGEGRTE